MIFNIVAWMHTLGAGRRSEEKLKVLRQAEVVRLALLGIHPDMLAGRLRLVLTTGCYRDFRFTIDILSTSASPEKIELAITALIGLGAQCDCEVFKAVGQLPRAILWHHPTAPIIGSSSKGAL